MAISVWGVDHGDEVSKAKPKQDMTKPSVGRVAAGTIFPGWHGAIAGKKGQKLKAAGTELGSGIGGGVAAGLVTRNNRGAVQLGTYGGSALGTAVAHRKGFLKKQS